MEGAGAHIDICLGAKGGRHSGRHAGVEALLDLHGGISSSGRGITGSAWRPGNLEACALQQGTTAMQSNRILWQGWMQLPAAVIKTAMRSHQKQRPTLVPAPHRPLYASHPFICRQAGNTGGKSPPCTLGALLPVLAGAIEHAGAGVNKGCVGCQYIGWLAGCWRGPHPAHGVSDADGAH